MDAALARRRLVALVEAARAGHAAATNDHTAREQGEELVRLFSFRYSHLGSGQVCQLRRHLYGQQRRGRLFVGGRVSSLPEEEDVRVAVAVAVLVEDDVAVCRRNIYQPHRSLRVGHSP